MKRRNRGLQLELLVEDALLEIVLGIEQQRHGLLARFADADLDDVAHFVRVGRRADRPLVRIEDVDADVRDRRVPFTDASP